MTHPYTYIHSHRYENLISYVEIFLFTTTARPDSAVCPATYPNGDSFAEKKPDWENDHSSPYDAEFKIT
jgi:hypothetical protein